MHKNISVETILTKSRYAAGKSQDYVAKCLGVSKKTIQNWESGYQQPNMEKLFMWFDCLGVPMYPYIMEALYPEEMANLTADTDMSELRDALHKYIDELDDLHARELLFILYGCHGSSPTGTLDICTAYLHLPLSMKIIICENIISTYEMADSIGFLKDENHIMPSMDTLKKYVSTAKYAVANGKETYTLIEE